MNQRAPGIVLGLGAIVLCLGLRAGGVLQGLELAVHDRFLRHGVETPAAGDDPARRLALRSPVLAVAIGEEAFARYGYPIPDAILARALGNLDAAGAAVIGVDLYRDGPASDDVADLAGWSGLEEFVLATPYVIVSELLASETERGIAPPGFAPPAQIGFNNLLLDPGRVVRRGYVFAWDDAGDAHQSLSLRMALEFLGRERIGLGPAPENPDWIRLGQATIPPLESDFGAYVGLDAGGYQFALDYARPDAAIETIGFEDLVEGRVGREAILGRVAIVGTDAPSVKDDFNAPQDPRHAVKGFRIHAHVVDQLIRVGRGESQVPRAWDEGVETAWVIGWGLGGIALAALLVSLGWAIPALVVGLLALVLSTASLFTAGIWVPTIAPALAWVSAGGVAMGDRARREAREQRQLMALFRRFSSRRVADELWRQRDQFMEGGVPRPQRVTITALLSDLKGYTAASEKMEPAELMEWIGSYMEAMTRVIEAHGGHVDDYVGDGIKANFGVPIPSLGEQAVAADARAAVRCAIEMGAALERLNETWAKCGWPTGRQRIGLFTGPAVVGTIGSDERTKYTSVGDTINTAARLESIGGALDFDRETALQRILVGERTHALVAADFEFAELGPHSVKGKAEPLEIYRVLGERPGNVGEEES